MHGLDSSVPLFHTHVRDTYIVVTPELVSDVLHVPRVEHPDYPECERLRTMSKEEMISAFMNMVMTFVLHPLSHYNSIIEPCARFLLSLLEHLTIDFPLHFILSIIDVYRDISTRDKLIFPSAITRILCHFFVPFPSSDHFPVMCAIDYATVKWREAQFRSRRTSTAAPPTPLAPSTSVPSSSAGGMTLDAIMV